MSTSDLTFTPLDHVGSDYVETLARSLGFGRAMDLFPDEVHAAYRRAAALRIQLGATDDPAIEPWPPMQCPATRG